MEEIKSLGKILNANFSVFGDAVHGFSEARVSGQNRKPAFC